MLFRSSSFCALLLSATVATASPSLRKRDSWGPSVGLGPAKQQIISTETTIYPGQMPPNQAAYLFAWLGISNGTGDLIQSIVGSYPKGGSECSGANADTTWCISSEVYGNTAAGTPNQFVGTLTTADVNYANGITFNYTLTDKSAYTWVQTMKDAKTGALLSTYTKNSGPMLGWGTALECNDNNGVACTGTIAEQIYKNSVIVLEAADPTFSQTLSVQQGATNTGMQAVDGGKTWKIAQINIPAMQKGSTVANPAASASTAAVASSISQHSVSTTVAQVASTLVTISSKAQAAGTTTTSSKHHGHTGHHVGGR